MDPNLYFKNIIEIKTTISQFIEEVIINLEFYNFSFGKF
jgi:hypothetical protein